ncbi:MAG: B12-binding domain-containing radical SAM protein [Deltaproteobacteria bacterium]|nr:MAG: B12-binding domain-containing radical SAM protein [Deltaproteobacteria bacterium]
MSTLVLVVVPTMDNAYHNLKDFVAIVPPIGLLSIAATAEAAGHRVVIVDADAERLDAGRALDRIAALQPDFVGATVMTATMDLCAAFFARLKERLPRVPVIVGGPHPSSLPVQTLRDAPAFDVAVIGEGDETIVELLKAHAAGGDLTAIPGIAFRCAGEVTVTAPRGPIPDLGILPLPAYHLLNRDLYRSYGWNNWVSGHRTPVGVVFAARGCVGRCNFCAAHTVFGHGIRYFPLETVKRQLDYLLRDWQIRVLYFQDDTFTANRKMVEALCDYIVAQGYDRQLEIMVSSRVDTVNPETLRRMRRAGVRWICFGVESGNQAILDRMGKKITVEQVRKAFRMAREAGLFIAGNFMIGHIGETRGTALDTIDLACELDQEYASFAIAIPLPGTELYDYCIDSGMQLPAWNDFGNVNTPPIPVNRELGAAELVALRNLAVNRFFKRPGYFLRLLLRMRPLNVMADFVRMYFALRKERLAKRL